MSVSAGMEERARLAKLREEVGPLESEAKPFNPLEPIKITQVYSSTAAAGSGEFFTFRKAKVREEERIRKMDDEWNRKVSQLEFEKKRQRVAEDLEKEREARRLKRQRRKQARQSSKASAESADGNTEHKNGSDSGSDTSGTDDSDHRGATGTDKQCNAKKDVDASQETKSNKSETDAAKESASTTVTGGTDNGEGGKADDNSDDDDNDDVAMLAALAAAKAKLLLQQKQQQKQQQQEPQETSSASKADAS